MGNKISRTCPICGTIYTADETRLKHGRQTTCSRDCSYTLRRNNQDKSITLTCGTCGRQFKRAPSVIKGKHGANFCNPECHYRGRTLGISKRVVTEPYIHSPDTLRRLSEAGAYAYAAGTTLERPKSELYVLSLLAELGEKTVYQFVVKGELRTYVVDFYLPERGIVIEIDGPEHGKPRVRKRDRDVDEILTSKGILPIRITLGSEDDLREAILSTLAGH